mgnify:CR=1 FL=1
MGMAPLAIYLRQAGYEVEAFDDSFSEPVRSLLESQGIGMLSDPAPSREPDAVVRSSAIPEHRPEVAHWKDLGIPTFRRGEFLADLLADRKVLAVVGSHGKTTTASMIVWLLKKHGYDFGHLVGGLFFEGVLPPAGYSEAPWVVVEVDESDGTIDCFSPELTLALNCDWDHSCLYGSRNDFKATLASLFARTKSCILSPIGSDLEESSRVSSRCNVVGFETDSDPASYNRCNALAALAACRAMGLSPKMEELDDFPGLERRQVTLLETKSRHILEDYAHHPVEIKAVLAEASNRSPERLLQVVFQPHRFSRTSALKAEFAEELSLVDNLFLLPTYGAFEEPDASGMAESLVDFLPPRLREQTKVFHDFNSLRKAIGPSPVQGDELLFLGAGSIERYARAFAAMESTGGNPWAAWRKYLEPRISSCAVLSLDKPLANLTTLRVGGSAKAYAEPDTLEDLRELVDACALFGFEFFVIGRGSNLIVPDEGYDGLVLRLSGESWRSVREVEGRALLADAGIRLKEICRVAMERGLSGFEFLEGIPGTLGGALRMNAGAMGGEFCDLVERVTMLMPDGSMREISGSDLTVEYRRCMEAEQGVVLRALLRGVGSSAKQEIRRRIDDFAQKRWKSQPHESSAGCIFRNPANDSAGRLIDFHGLKGESIGGASVSNVHANFIVNEGEATADEVIGLIRRVRKVVKDSSGVVLEPEVTLMGKSWKETFS